MPLQIQNLFPEKAACHQVKAKVLCAYPPRYKATFAEKLTNLAPLGIRKSKSFSDVWCSGEGDSEYKIQRTENI